MSKKRAKNTQPINNEEIDKLKEIINEFGAADITSQAKSTISHYFISSEFHQKVNETAFKIKNRSRFGGNFHDEIDEEHQEQVIEHVVPVPINETIQNFQEDGEQNSQGD